MDGKVGYKGREWGRGGRGEVMEGGRVVEKRKKGVSASEFLYTAILTFLADGVRNWTNP